MKDKSIAHSFASALLKFVDIIIFPISVHSTFKWPFKIWAVSLTFYSEKKKIPRMCALSSNTRAHW